MPKRHSVPVLESCYDSVNARKQTYCPLCNKVRIDFDRIPVRFQAVFLAERMQVESTYIHKNCFRCAFCTQPLRLGEYGKDKDLEFHYPMKYVSILVSTVFISRFFCNTHLKIPLREKIARIERTNRTMPGRSNSKECAAVPPLPATKPPPVEE